MKKTIYILLTILLSLTLIGAKAQETPPSGLKSVNGQFYISLADSSIWQNKGVPYGWQRVARYKDIKNLPTQAIINAKIDSLKAADNPWTGSNNFSGNSSIYIPTFYGDGVGNGGVRFKNVDGTVTELYYGSGTGPNHGYLDFRGDNFQTENIYARHVYVDGYGGSNPIYDLNGAHGLTNMVTGKNVLFQGDVPSTGHLDSTYAKKESVIKNQNTITQSANAKISGNITSSSQTISNGTDSVRTTIESIGGNAGSTFIRAKGYIITTPYETNTALRWYEMPNGTPTGTAMKHEFFLSDYKADSVNYRAAELIGDNTRGDIIFGANRRGTATALRLRLVRDNVASTYQPSSNQINFNTDNTLDIYGTTIFHRSTSRNNFYAGGVGTYQGAITSVGWLITQDSTTTHTYPLELNKSITGITRMGITNPTAGTGNGAGIIIRSDIANQFSITALSSTFTSSGTNRQSGVNITSAGAGGLDIGATNAAGAVYLSTGGTAAANRRILIDNSGNTIIAVSTKTPLLTLTGLSSGTAGTDSLLTKNPTTNVVSKIAANYYAPSARTLTAGIGITGGGDLSANRTIAVDTANIASKTFAGRYAQTNQAASHTTITTTAAPAYTTGGFKNAVVNTTTGRIETVTTSTPVIDATTTAYTMAAGTRYISDNAALITFTLPTSAAQGDIFIITGYGAGLWKIAQNSGQTIHGATDTTTGATGFLQATGRYNSIQLVCVKANTDFTVQSSQGSLTVN